MTWEGSSCSSCRGVIGFHPNCNVIVVAPLVTIQETQTQSGQSSDLLREARNPDVQYVSVGN